MRSAQRNWRSIHYADLIGSEPIKDEYGNDTLEVRNTYGSPTLLRVSVSANAGQEAVSVFGALTGYSRTISYSGDSCPLDEGSLIWFDTDVDGPHNYVVVKVADSKNGYLIAIREVSKRG
jgi:hypothetical protein